MVSVVGLPPPANRPLVPLEQFPATFPKAYVKSPKFFAFPSDIMLRNDMVDILGAPPANTPRPRFPGLFCISVNVLTVAQLFPV